MKIQAHDKDCNVIKCDKCDKDAGYIAVGLNNQIALCEDHSPYADELKE